MCLTVCTLFLSLVLKVTCWGEPVISVPTLIDGEQATLTCSVPGQCPSTCPQITWLMDTREVITQLNGDNARDSYTSSKGNTTSMLTLNPSYKMHWSDVICSVSNGNVTKTLTVNYLVNPRIKGDIEVKEGTMLNLTCSAESNLPSLNVSWLFKRAALSGLTQDSLRIVNVSREQAGEYVCTVKHYKKAATTSVNVTVIYPPKIHNNSDCVLEEDVLICKCISSGLPIPSISWPEELVQNPKSHTESEAHGHINTSTIQLKGSANNWTFLVGVKCATENTVGRTWKVLDVKMDKKGTGSTKFGLRTISILVVGVTSSALTACVSIGLVVICIRCTAHKIKDGKTGTACVDVEAGETHHCQDDGNQTGAVIEDTAVDAEEVTQQNTPGEDKTSVEEESPDEGEEEDVKYASINYSVLQMGEAEVQMPQREETDYAEICPYKPDDKGVMCPEGVDNGVDFPLENYDQSRGKEADLISK